MKHHTSLIKQRQPRFERHRLPSPAVYYQGQFDTLKGRGKWAQTLCPFHAEKHPSFSVNLETGAYHCFSCGARGRDIVDFHCQKYGLDFRSAADALGAMI